MLSIHDPERVKPSSQVWLPDPLPLFLIRFYDTCIRSLVQGNAYAVIPKEEHVYKPTGVYTWTPKRGKVFQYKYEQTRKVV